MFWRFKISEKIESGANLFVSWKLKNRAALPSRAASRTRSLTEVNFVAIFLILTHAMEWLSHKSIDLYSFAQMV